MPDKRHEPKRYEAIQRANGKWGVWDKKKRKWATQADIPNQRRAKALARGMNLADPED